MWEYKIESFVTGSIDGKTSAINHHGLEGWELISVNDLKYFVFKRKIIKTKLKNKV